MELETTLSSRQQWPRNEWAGQTKAWTWPPRIFFSHVKGKWDYFCEKDTFVDSILHMFELFPKWYVHQCLNHLERSATGAALVISWQCDVFMFGLQCSSWLPQHTAVAVSLWISVKWHGLFCLLDLVFTKLGLTAPDPAVNAWLW